MHRVPGILYHSVTVYYIYHMNPVDCGLLLFSKCTQRYRCKYEQTFRFIECFHSTIYIRFTLANEMRFEKRYIIKSISLERAVLIVTA